MPPWLLTLAADPQVLPDHAGGGGFIGWPLVFGTLLFMNTWLMVYSVFLAGQRDQGIYYWMLLTFFGGPVAIALLLRHPVVRACPVCGVMSPLQEADCAECGYHFTAQDQPEHPARLPQDFDDDDLTS
ncbi:MAG: hypothetical protein GEEBNDBF_01220 [bacterium]|nr:hypothetical protein [bacterium]